MKQVRTVGNREKITVVAGFEPSIMLPSRLPQPSFKQPVNISQDIWRLYKEPKGAQLTNFPYSKYSKAFCFQDSFSAKKEEMSHLTQKLYFQVKKIN